jgi:hypothetical protein
VLSVITVAATYLPAINSLEEGKSYHTRTKGVSGHGLGPPHPHVLVRYAIAIPTTGGDYLDIVNNFLKKYCTPTQFTTDDEEVLNQTSDANTAEMVAARMNKTSIDKMRTEICRHVQVFRATTCHDTNFVNITFASRSPCETIQAMMKAMIAHACEHGNGNHRFGQAPPKQTERQIQSILRRLEDDSDQEEE